MIFQQPSENPSLFWSSCIQDPATSGESCCWERVFAERGAQAPKLNIELTVMHKLLWHLACYHILLTLTGNPTCYQLQRPFVQHTHCSQVSDGGAAAIFMSEEAMSFFCCRSVRWDTEDRKAPVNARAWRSMAWLVSLQWRLWLPIME